MVNPKPHLIQPHQRGHRKPLSEFEPTERRTIRLPASLAAWWDKIGPKHIRELLVTDKEKADPGNSQTGQ